MLRRRIGASPSRGSFSWLASAGEGPRCKQRFRSLRKGSGRSVWVSARASGELSFHRDFAPIELRLGGSHRFGSAARTAFRRRDRMRASGASAQRARSGIIVRVMDFHFVGSSGSEQALRRLGRDGTRGSLRRAGRSDKTKLEASVFSVDTRRFGAVTRYQEISL